jgi:hypothetical protein
MARRTRRERDVAGSEGTGTREKLEPLVSASVARTIGYREGAAERLRAGGDRGAVDRIREGSYENHPEHRHVRGTHIVHYRAWRAGFDAGYLGLTPASAPTRSRVPRWR